MYNEAKNIERTIEGLSGIAGEIARDYEIIVSDDGSSDGCGEIVGKISAKDPRVKCIRLEKNTKFGGALNAGLKAAAKDIVIYTDSDLPVDAKDIKGALALLDNADAVTAYSTVKKGENLKRIIMSVVYNLLIKAFFNTKIRDINSGFKIYKRKILDGETFISRSPFIDVEIFVKAMRKDYKIAQYPVIFKHRQAGKSYISRPAVVWQTFTDMIRFRING